MIRPRPDSRTHSESSLAATISAGTISSKLPARSATTAASSMRATRWSESRRRSTRRRRAASSAAGTPDARRALDRGVGVGQEVLRALGIAVDEVRTVDPLLDLPDERCRLGDGLACDGGARNRFGRARGRQGPNHHAEREEPGDEPHADHPEPPAASLLAIRRPRDAARVLGSPPWDEREDPRQEREERPPDRRAHPLGRVPRRVEAAADRVGQRHRALVRQAGEWLRGANRLELVHRLGGGQLGDLDRQQSVRPGPAADGEDLLEVLDRRGRPHLGKRAPQLVHSHGLREVPADERDAVTGGQRAMPGERLDLDRLAEGRRDPTAPDARILIGRRREAAGPRTSAPRGPRPRSPDRPWRRAPPARERRRRPR